MLVSFSGITSVLKNSIILVHVRLPFKHPIFIVIHPRFAATVSFGEIRPVFRIDLLVLTVGVVLIPNDAHDQRQHECNDHVEHHEVLQILDHLSDQSHEVRGLLEDSEEEHGLYCG